VTGKKKALIAVGITGGLWLLSKLYAASKLHAQLVGLKVGDIGFTDGQLLIQVTPTIKVTNTSNIAATANAFTGSLFSADGRILIGTFNVQFTEGNRIVIPALGSALVNITASINAIASARALLQDAKNIRLDARLNVNGIPVPINTTLAIGCACE